MRPDKTIIKKKATKRISLFLPLKHVLPYIGIIIGLVLFIFQASIIAYTENVMGKFLMNIVQYETRGRYMIAYDKVKFNIFNSKVTLTNFILHQDSTTLITAEKGGFNLDAGLLSLDLNNLFGFIIDKKLDVRGLEIINPTFQIIKNNTIDPGESSQNTQMVIDKISAYLSEFKVQELSIQHADLILTSVLPDTIKTLEITDISILINDFIVTSDSESKTLFSSENFEIEILNEVQKIDDKNKISFKRLWLSARDSVLFLENLQLSSSDKNLNEYTVYFPEVKFSKVDLRKLIHENIFETDVLDLGKGLVSIKISGKTSKKENSKKGGIPEIIIGELVMDDTDIIVEFPFRDSTRTIYMNGIDLSIKNLELDSATMADPMSLVNKIDLQMHMDDYFVDMIDWQHKIFAQNISFDYGKGFWSFDSLKISPHEGKIIDAHKVLIPNAIFSGIDFREAINTKILKGSKLEFINPNISSRFGTTSSSKNRIDFDYRNIFPIVQTIFPSISLNSLEIKNLKLDLRNRNNQQLFQNENINISLGEILIDSNMFLNRKQIFGVSVIEFELDNATLFIPDSKTEISIGELDFKSSSGKFDIRNFSLITRSQFVDKIKINRFQVHGLDWEALINENDFFLDTLLIDRVSIVSRVDTINVLTDTATIATKPFFPDHVRIGVIEMKHGTARLESLKGNRSIFNNLYASVRGLSISKGDQYMNWNSTAVYVSSGDFTTGLINGTHQLSGHSAYFSKSDSTIRLNLLKLVPVKKSLDEPAYNIEVPKLLITGVLPAQLMDSSHLHIKEVLLIDPKIKLSLIPGTQKPTTQKKEPWLHHMELANLKLINADMNISYLTDSIEHEADFKGFYLDIESINYDTAMHISDPFTYFGNISIKGNQVNYSGAKQVDSLRIQSFVIDSEIGGSFTDISLGITQSGNNVTATIPNVSFFGDSWLQNIHAKNYYLDSILVNQPSLTINIGNNQSSTNKKQFQDTLLVSKIRINNGSLNLTLDSISYQIPKFDIAVTNLNYQDPKPNTLYSDNIDLTVYELNDVLKDKFNRIDISKIYLSTRLGYLEMNGLEVTPKFSKMEFGREKGFQTDWLTLKNNKIIVSGININKYLENNFLEISNIEIDSLDMQLFRDKNIKFPETQVRYMPQKMLRDIGIPINIHRVDINNLDVVYEELAQGQTTAGVLDFTNLSAFMKNVTNDSSAIAKDSIMQVTASAKIMETGNLQIDIEYDLKSKENEHSYFGHLGRWELTELNKFLEPAVNVQIKSGVINKLDLHVSGNDHYSIGKMTLFYNDLHIRAISKKTDKPKGMGPAFVTFFANTFVIKRNNRLLVPREGAIYAERDTARSVFNYLAKTALSGVVSSIGARNNRKDIKRLNKEAKEIKDKKRLRLLRKEEKKEQKQEKKDDRKSNKGVIENKDEN